MIGTIFVKFSQELILTKIIKIVATRCQIFRPKCTKFNFGWGSASGPAGGAHSAPQTSQLDLRGLLVKRGERKEGGIPSTFCGSTSTNVSTLRSGFYCRKSVCRLSVCLSVCLSVSRCTLLRGWSFRQYFFTAVYLGYLLITVQNFTRIVLAIGGVKRKSCSKIERVWTGVV